LDVGKQSLLCTLRWGTHDFDRPWRVANPSDLTRWAELMAELDKGRTLLVAMEPTGTYGDAARQALQRVGLIVQRVSPKQAKDYAEVFDGVPSQHDGKDAAVVAELAALGRSWPWPLLVPTEAEQELAFQVTRLDDVRRAMMPWCGRVEGLLSRHWPEATQVMALSSGTLLKCLATYGGPHGLAQAVDGWQRVKAFGGPLLSEQKAKDLVACAGRTLGVRTGRWDEEQLRRYADEIRRCKADMGTCRRRLAELAAAHATIKALSTVVGV
jgi:transposase